MKIVFLTGGARELALECLLKHKENVVAVITPVLSNSNSRFRDVIKTATEYGVKVIQVTKETLSIELEKIDFDLLISCGFSYIIDLSILKNKPAINCHPTLLPAYRGFRSGPYQIINGEKKSGVTIHKLSNEMDRGDIILQGSFEITMFDTTKSVYRKARELEPELLLKAVQLFKKGEVKYIPQDESKASEFNQIRTPKDSEINPAKPLLELYNEIRACDPDDYPAFFYIDGQQINVKLWRPGKTDDESDLI